MLQETSLGVNADVALQNLGERVSSADMEMVITAITIQRSVGGNLAQLLDGVSYTMRERERIRGDIKTLTSQQRMTGIVIGALPFFLGLLFFAINPDYMGVLFTETVGRVFIVVAAGAGSAGDHDDPRHAGFGRVRGQMFALIISIVVFASVSLLVMALSRPRLSAIEARIASLRRPGGRGAGLRAGPPLRGASAGAHWCKASAVVLSNFLPATFLAGIQKSLATAGLKMTAITFVTFWAICVGLFSSLGLLAIVVLGGFSAQGLMGLMVMGGIGFLIPWMWLKSAVRSRQRLIVKALPDALDLVTTCVEAGLGLDAALGRVAEQMKGPLAVGAGPDPERDIDGTPAPGSAERSGSTHRRAGADLFC